MRALYLDLKRGKTVTVFGKVWTLETVTKDFIVLKYMFTYEYFKRWYKLIRLEYMLDNPKEDKPEGFEQLTFM